MSNVKLLNNEPPTFYSLEFSHERLNLCREFMNDNTMVIRETLPSLAHHLVVGSSALTSVVSSAVHNSKLLINFFGRDSMDKKIDKLSFINLSTVLILIPEGFDGLLSEYGLLLNKMTPIVIDAGYSFANQFRNSLAYVLTNREAKESSKSFSDLINEYKKLREDTVKIFDVFHIDGNKSRTSLGSVVENKEQLKSTLINGQDLSAKLKAINIHKYKSDIDEIVTLLDALEKQIKEDSTVKFSPQVISLISDGSYELAKFYEYISVLLYKDDSYVASVEDIRKIIEKNS